MFKFKKSSIFLFFVGLYNLIPTLAFAEDNIALREAYNRELLSSISSEFLNNPALSWGSGFLGPLFLGCFIIAIFQSALKNTPDKMFTELIRIGLVSFLVLMILGKINPHSYGLNLVRGAPSAYQYYNKPGASPSLEREGFNFLAWKFDALGNALFGRDSNGNPINPTSYYQEQVDKLSATSNQLIDARQKCNEDINCIRSVVNTGTPPEGFEKDDRSWFNIGAYFDDLILKISSSFTWIKILLFFLDILRAGLTFAVLISFGVITASTLFFIKLFAPFAILSSFQGKFIGALKVAMSASMYGFLLKLIIFFSAVITKAMGGATNSIIVAKINDSAGFSEIISSLGVLSLSNAVALLVIVFFQIIAISKVPSLARKLINLSLEEFINLGQALFGAAMGMAAIAGGVAGTALAGGALLGAGALRGGIGKGGDGASDGFASAAKGASGGASAGFAASAAAGMGGDSSSGPKGGSGFTGGSSKEKSSSGAVKASMAGGNVDARMSQPSSILKKPEKEARREELLKNKQEKSVDNPRTPLNKKSILDKKDVPKNAEIDSDGRILLKEDKDKIRKQRIKAGLAKTAGVVGALGVAGGKLAMAGFKAGAGGDASGEVASAMGGIKKALTTEDAYNTARKKTQAAKQGTKNWAEERKLKNAERSVLMSEMMDKSDSYSSQTVESEEDKEYLNDLMGKVESNTASDSEKFELYKANNKYSFDGEIQERYDDILSDDSIDYASNDKFAKEEALNQKLMNRVSSSLDKGKQLSNKDLREMNYRMEQGLMSAGTLGQMKTKEFDYENKKTLDNEISIRERLSNDSQNYVGHELGKIQSRMEKNPNYKVTKRDRDIATYMTTGAMQSVVGNDRNLISAIGVLGEKSETGSSLGRIKSRIDYEKAVKAAEVKNEKYYYDSDFGAYSYKTKEGQMKTMMPDRPMSQSEKEEVRLAVTNVEKMIQSGQIEESQKDEFKEFIKKYKPLI